MEMKDHPIGIFDSGLGGLTVFKAVRRMLPDENLIYFGDTARVPYGTKSRAAVISFSKEISSYLLLRKVKMLVVACNTASSLALGEIRGLTDIPVIGVIKPSAQAALDITPHNGRILVIGTAATVSSGAYSSALLSVRKDVKVTEQACPLFVPLVEEGWTGKKITADVAEEYLSRYRGGKVNTLILGCTHYPLIEKTVAGVMGQEVNIVNSARAAALAVKAELSARGLLSDSGKKGRDSFIVSDAPERFSELARRLLKIHADSVSVKRF